MSPPRPISASSPMLDVPANQPPPRLSAKVGASLERVCMDAAFHYSDECLMVAACEEMAELQQLLCRAVNGKSAKLSAIQSELADVTIMTTQMLRLFFKDSAEFSAMVNRKLSKREKKVRAAAGGQRPAPSITKKARKP